ncbi:MAG: hypothetical protein IJ814_04425 [Paludibacteraceae bacterium]|nr:hypothetical protein [Paludibacteraceae bacterium]
MTACVPQAPQRPSTRKGAKPAPDSTQLALMELNLRLAQAADEELVRYVQASGKAFALYDNHTWMCVRDKGDDTLPHLLPEGQWVVHMEVYDLNGKRLADIQRQYRIGKMELPPAVDDCVVYLHPRAQALLAAPWYMAFGAAGGDGVPPYTNVLIDLKIL